MPTLLDIVGLEIPDTVQSKSLLPLINGTAAKVHDFVVSSFPLYNSGDPSKIVDDWLRTVEAPHFSTLTTDRWSFLYSTEADPAELYDLHDDPAESKNVIESNQNVAREFHEKLVAFFERIGVAERLLGPRRKLRIR